MKKKFMRTMKISDRRAKSNNLQTSPTARKRKRSKCCFRNKSQKKSKRRRKRRRIRPRWIRH